MSTLPTATLTFEDLVIEVARKIGIAYYGSDGTEKAQVPIDSHDLDECKRHVNNAIRMFLFDSPPAGWRFAKPVASITLWASIAVDSDNKITSSGYDPNTDKTTLSVTDDSFYDTMEGHNIVLTGVDTFTITDYVSATGIKVSGDATGAGTGGVTWSMTADGNYTLPRTFGGQYEGRPTYAADTNEGVQPQWQDESTIRVWRETGTESGTPYMVGIRPKATLINSRRRWELLTYPIVTEDLTLEFQYQLYFDKLVDLDEYPPIPPHHDETLKTACLAIVERDVDEAPGSCTSDYRDRCLPQSHVKDARSAPRTIGSFNRTVLTHSSQIQRFRDKYYIRPTVTFNE